ncbi:Uncharacterized NAD(P)/FAD-binding protein YdhS [Rhizobium sp. RU35A]|uniref:FAD/NAD(P)-binding protein n=1 Tax=Rhizobium sp. RU35A TaxID=1907414 RepID=UPI00095693BC|nr:FAD/NAD(P)-binding protein [Rhizobium sp. RU35A]SIQ42218.1 Uncharacterized NAD(P)/FAD-binding protein YdhS [Rhizobium sp. RU35A]
MTLHIVIIGGGASGTLAAAHLLRQRETPRQLRLTLVEAHHEIGCGIAYSTPDSCHILNTRVQNMSAFPDEPDHFSRYLAREGLGSGEPMSFVSRKVYGRYLQELLADGSGQSAVPRLAFLRQECVGLAEHAHGVEVKLADGSVVPCHHAILATGYARDGRSQTALEDPWCPTTKHDPDRPVILIGTGLTMVDMVLSLLGRGHRAPIYALSRRGLLPQPHRVTRPLKLSAADIPFGTSLAYLLRWMRATIHDHVAIGGDWRDVIDGLRPHTQALWRHLPAASRARFLRHVSSLWDTHRHRMPPESETRIRALLANGQLSILRGAFQGAAREDGETRITYRAAGSGTLETLSAQYAIDCRGFRRLQPPITTPLLASLIGEGQAAIDPLGLGLVFDRDDRLVDQTGRSHARIFGLGPLTRATHWEITAVPDIREQAARLAARLLDHDQPQAIETPVSHRR